MAYYSLPEQGGGFPPADCVMAGGGFECHGIPGISVSIFECVSEIDTQTRTWLANALRREHPNSTRFPFQEGRLIRPADKAG